MVERSTGTFYKAATITSRKKGADKKAADSKGICGFRFANYVRLILNFYMLDGTGVTCAGVVNAHPVFWRQRPFHDVPRLVDYANSGAKSEPDWPLFLSLNHN